MQDLQLLCKFFIKDSGYFILATKLLLLLTSLTKGKLLTSVP
jgi:hypothetical protein